LESWKKRRSKVSRKYVVHQKISDGRGREKGETRLNVLSNELTLRQKTQKNLKDGPAWNLKQKKQKKTTRRATPNYEVPQSCMKRNDLDKGTHTNSQNGG